MSGSPLSRVSACLSSSPPPPPTAYALSISQKKKILRKKNVDPVEVSGWLSLSLGFDSGYDLRVVGLSLMSGSVLRVESAWDSLPLLP